MSDSRKYYYIHHNAVRTAVEVAQRFQNELIPKMKFILMVYRNTGYSGFITQTVSDLSAEDFCQTGLKRFSPEQRNMEITLYRSLNHEHYVSACDSVPQILHILDIPEFTDDEPRNDALAKAHFDELLKDVLNTLEWVSMLIDTGTADGDTIYESLHHILVPFVRVNYFHYAKLDNANRPQDKYFTYTKRVYEAWRQKENAVQKTAVESMTVDKRDKPVDIPKESEYTTVGGD